MAEVNLSLELWSALEYVFVKEKRAVAAHL
jgi:hypothetical protein